MSLGNPNPKKLKKAKKTHYVIVCTVGLLLAISSVYIINHFKNNSVPFQPEVTIIPLVFISGMLPSIISIKNINRELKELDDKRESE